MNFLEWHYGAGLQKGVVIPQMKLLGITTLIVGLSGSSYLKPGEAAHGVVEVTL